MPQLAYFALLIAFICSLSGCATSQAQAPRTTYMPEASIQGLVEDRSQYPALLYRRPGAPKIGSYDRYIVGDVRIRVADSDMNKIPSKDLEYMADYLKVAIRHELGNAGYNVGAGYGNSALRMEFVLSGFEVLDAAEGSGTQSDGNRSDGA
ncbi:MAG: hypothetical protein JKY43_01115 [Phycisphaerales bacterium]|nr:hypothetical protein [Phycisphaerales bacterium]